MILMRTASLLQYSLSALMLAGNRYEEKLGLGNAAV